jgi:hypothetical protein
MTLAFADRDDVEISDAADSFGVLGPISHEFNDFLTTSMAYE